MSKTKDKPLYTLTHKSLWLPTSFAIIFGSFNLGLFVAIQGPTLMDLIDLLHINNDTMSVTLAFSSLAYSVGGLLSGVMFNYIKRPILITILFICFGLCNIVTPFITNYLVFTVITCFKMICAGGTDCGGSVWILDIWPGKDEWLQALHFTFAVGTALGPLIVEPFLSADYAKAEAENNGYSSGGGLMGIKDKTSGSSTISDQNNETRIHVPFIFSGLLSISAGFILLYLHYKSERLHRDERKRQASSLQAEMGQQQLQLLPMKKIKSRKNKISSSSNNQLAELNQLNELKEEDEEEEEDEIEVNTSGDHQAAKTLRSQLNDASSSPRSQTSAKLNDKQQDDNNKNKNATESEQTKTINDYATTTPTRRGRKMVVEPLAELEEVELEPYCDQPSQQQQQQNPNSTSKEPSQSVAVDIVEPAKKNKITSKVREDRDGRPPYYVMFAVALAAMSLSFYCGVEITSMNYLATFAVNIDLQLSKSTAALMSSALTISFAVGRGGGVYMAARMKPHKLFYICTLTMIFGNILMLIFANTYEILLWFSVCLFGLGCAPLYPAIVSFFDYRIMKVTNTVSGIFISGSMFNVALNSLIIGHHIIDNALILLFCNLAGSIVLLLLFGTLHMLSKVKTNQRVKKYELNQKKSLELQQLQTQQQEQSQ